MPHMPWPSRCIGELKHMYNQRSEGKKLEMEQSKENITVTRSLAKGRSTKALETTMTHPNRSNSLLPCKEGLPSGIFVSGGRLTTFQDFEVEIALLWSKVLARNKGGGLLLPLFSVCNGLIHSQC